MRRWWLVIALLLSVGLNVGILAAIAARRINLAAGAGAKQPGAVNQPPDPLPRLPQLANRLGLEGEERRKFLDIQWNLYQETSHLRLQLGETHRNLRHELIHSPQLLDFRRRPADNHVRAALSGVAAFPVTAFSALPIAIAASSITVSSSCATRSWGCAPFTTRNVGRSR